MSYLYARAVSLIPAAYYADLAYKRGRHYLNDLWMGLALALLVVTWGVRWWIGKETERECSMRMKGKAVVRKHALSTKDLTMVADHYSKSSDYDHLLFVAMLYTGFFGLVHLSELTFPDDKSIQNWRKVTRRSSVLVKTDTYEFHLPGHKADRFFEGNRIIMQGLVEF